jgi:hypothetical protein
MAYIKNGTAAFMFMHHATNTSGDYIQISREKLLFRNVCSGRAIHEVPLEISSCTLIATGLCVFFLSVSKYAEVFRQKRKH